MLKIDRMNFPNRYKLRDVTIIIVILAALFGIWLNDHSQRNIAKQIIISDVTIADYGTNYVNVDYTVQNLGAHSREIRLLAKVFDAKSQEIGSAMFIIEVPPRSKQDRNKLFDDLNRALAPGEKPAGADVRFYPRKVF